MYSSPASAQENARNNIIREIVETERKYVQDLEHMQVRCVATPTPPSTKLMCLMSIYRNTLTL